jgi:hypothetical protein
MLLTTVAVELVEFLLVALLSGGIVTDQAAYFEMRNRTGFLAAKFGYNTLGGILGGYVAAAIAGRRPLLHGALLAGLQTAAFGLAMARPDLASTAPRWAWVGFTFTTAAGILAGARIQERRSLGLSGAPGAAPPNRIDLS